MLEGKNAILQEQTMHLRQELASSESRRDQAEEQVKQLQRELTKATKQAAMTEASLTISNKVRFN